MRMISLRSMRLVRRKRRIRRKINGAAGCPRLSVFRSLHHIYVQAIDDEAGSTLASASTLESDLRQSLKGSTNNASSADAVGRLIAERLVKKGVKKVVLDRNGRPYHGRLKALAEAARGAGLEF